MAASAPGAMIEGAGHHGSEHCKESSIVGLL